MADDLPIRPPGGGTSVDLTPPDSGGQSASTTGSSAPGLGDVARPQQPAITAGIGVPVADLPAAPLGDSVSGFVPNPYEAALLSWRQQLVAQFGEGRIPGTRLTASELNVPLSDADVVQVPGVGLTSMTALLQQPLRSKSAKILTLQRRLVAAGYISDSSIDTPGWYDYPTQQAYRYLIEESIQRGQTPAQVLRSRILIRQGMNPDEVRRVVTESGLTEDEHRAALSDAYARAWGQAPPPNYVNGFMNMNPDEFEAFERAKEGWESTGIAQAEQDEIEQQVRRHLYGGS